MEGGQVMPWHGKGRGCFQGVTLVSTLSRGHIVPHDGHLLLRLYTTLHAKFLHILPLTLQILVCRRSSTAHPAKPQELLLHYFLVALIPASATAGLYFSYSAGLSCTKDFTFLHLSLSTCFVVASCMGFAMCHILTSGITGRLISAEARECLCLLIVGLLLLWADMSELTCWREGRYLPQNQIILKSDCSLGT